MTSLNIGAARDQQITQLKAHERVIGRVYKQLLPPDFRIEFIPGDDAPP